jgi:hypothetical protein
MKRPTPLTKLVPLLAVFSALAGCAPMDREGSASTPAVGPARPSVANPGDLQQVAVIREVIDTQARTLDAESVEATPDCTRIRLLARNICTLAEHICAIAGRYPVNDPIRDSCTDARARCRRANEVMQQLCTAPTE